MNRDDFTWEERFTSRTYQRFPNPGDTVAGVVLHYSPLSGETRYKSEEQCGYVDLRRFDTKEAVRVVLDKEVLADCVAACYPAPGLGLAITYTATVKGDKGSEYKQFRVWAGTPK